MRQQIETHQKALDINLDERIYGTFAEIGAGQEVARHFFQAGAAAGTIAKTMSAYDKVYSDEIYGIEGSGRYVCESRIYKMLDHEYDLMESRLQMERPDTCFFVFADTIAAINYHRTIKGDGWLGIRFQLEPKRKPNDLIIHVRMLDNDNRLQQQAIGILGVNLIYACFEYSNDPEMLLLSLMDNLRGRIKIDMVRLTGPQFEEIDNRVLSLYLIKNKLSEVAMFGPQGQNVHPSEFLYRKYVMVVREDFCPLTLRHVDLINSSYEQFKQDKNVDPNKTFLLLELPIDRLKNEEGDLNIKNFQDRAAILNEMGYTVMLTDYSGHHILQRYFRDYKIGRLTIVLEARQLLHLINRLYYDNQDGKLLTAFGDLFSHNLSIYTFPSLQEGSAELMSAKNLPIPEGVTFLFQHLHNHDQIVDIAPTNPEVLNIFSSQVLKMIKDGQPGWEPLVPNKVARLIKSHYLFDYPSENIEFEY